MEAQRAHGEDAAVSRVERRRTQNRVNQRAARRRKAAQAELHSDLDATQGREVSRSQRLLAAIVSDNDDFSDRFEIEQLRALSVSLTASSHLDQARILSPLLADARLRKVWSTAANVLWPPLEYLDERGGRKRELTWSFLRHSFADPLLFHAHTCTNATAIGMMDSEPLAFQNMAVYHENQAVQLLRREIEQKDVTLSRDEALFAILLLSSRGFDDMPIVVENRTMGSFRPPLTSLQNLQIGSSIRFNDLHREALKKLVVQKGGIAQINMPCLAEFFTTMDLFQASVRCAKPDFGLCRTYAACLESDVQTVRRRHQQETATPFAFPVVDLENTFQDLLWDIRCYLDMIKAYVGGARRKPPHVPLPLCRNLIQHRILSIECDASNRGRELCRLAVLLFSCVVVYPLQNLVPMQRYLDELTQLLKIETDVEDDFRLWLLILGAMAADQTPLQLWYIPELKLLAPKYGRSWSALREVLESFLWLDIACGEGALEVWHRVIIV